MVLVCEPVDGDMPISTTRRKIEREIKKRRHEHPIIFVDGERTEQIWQWVKRERGQSEDCREQAYHLKCFTKVWGSQRSSLK